MLKVIITAANIPLMGISAGMYYLLMFMKFSCYKQGSAKL
jgi:hypothetical protein